MDIIARQVELEKEMSSLGVNRYRSQVQSAKEKGQESRTKYGMGLISYGIEPVSQAIEAFVAGTKGPGRKHVAIKYLKHLDANVVAYLTLRTAVDCMCNSTHAALQRVSLQIGSALENEAKYAKFKHDDEAYFKKVKKYVKEATSARYKQAVANKGIQKAEIKWERWPARDRYLLGQKCIEIMIEQTGWFDIRKVPAKGRAYSHKLRSKKAVSYEVAATEKLTAWIMNKNARCEMLSPVFLPCLIPPRDWTGPQDGGYHTGHVPQMRLIKTNKDGYLEELENRVEEMPALYDAVNALQHTAWKINRKVYEVINTFWDRDLPVKGLPARDDHPLPPKPAGLDLGNRKAWTEEEQTAWKEWKHAASKVHKANIKLMSLRLQTQKTFWLADKYRDEAEFYMPYQYDFRGRVYSVVSYLSPQGADLARGLLTFAKGKPIMTQEQADWLAIHGANLWGEDKLPMEDRVKWVHDNEDMIFAIAEDPYSNTEWTGVSKAVQFLAFCFEWKAFRDHGMGYVSSLPIAMDGTCNGLQIFSLVLRDAVGGKAVNLLPSDRPQDIYQVVADLTMEKVRNVAQNGGEDEKQVAQEWVEFGLDRAGAKRVVMCLPYGLGKYSAKGYVEEYVHGRIKDEGGCPWDEADIFPAVAFLTDLMWEALDETVIAARECMSWLQGAAKVAASANLPVTWTTPDGFPVLQAYQATHLRRIETMLGDQAIKLSLSEDDNDSLDRTKQRNSISPNWVHSLDGAALRMTVCRAVEKGIDSFAMIHDSYGTVAADAPELGRTLRDVFVDTFTEHDVLTEFKDSVLALVPEDMHDQIGELPSMGTLDIEQVRKSAFFFA